jgi:hypothetical protein
LLPLGGEPGRLRRGSLAVTGEKSHTAASALDGKLYKLET